MSDAVVASDTQQHQVAFGVVERVVVHMVHVEQVLALWRCTTLLALETTFVDQAPP